MHHEVFHMKTLARQKSRGFILITVLFLITVLASMAVVLSSTTSVQSLTTMYALQQARGFAAAKSGLEYGIQRAAVPAGAGTCTNGGITLPGIDFNVTLSCTVINETEAGAPVNVYTISATATTGTFGNVGYVTRTIRAQVNN